MNSSKVENTCGFKLRGISYRSRVTISSYWLCLRTRHCSFESVLRMVSMIAVIFDTRIIAHMCNHRSMTISRIIIVFLYVWICRNCWHFTSINVHFFCWGTDLWWYRNSWIRKRKESTFCDIMKLLRHLERKRHEVPNEQLNWLRNEFIFLQKHHKIKALNRWKLIIIESVV